MNLTKFSTIALAVMVLSGCTGSGDGHSSDAMNRVGTFIGKVTGTAYKKADTVQKCDELGGDWSASENKCSRPSKKK